MPGLDDKAIYYLCKKTQTKFLLNYFTFPPQKDVSYCYSTSFPAFSIISILNFRHLIRCIVMYIIYDICYTYIDLDISSLVRYLFRFLVHLLVEFLTMFLNFNNCLYILD